MKPLIEVKDLKKYFPVHGGAFKKPQFVQAVDGVSFTIQRGETLGLVGESGCGKSTIGRTMLRLYEPTAGNILFDGKDITTGSMTPYRRRMQIIFQDPYASLDPRMTVGDIVGEPLDIHRICKTRAERNEKGAGPSRPRRPQFRAHEPLPPRVLRRTAPAYLHCTVHGAQPGIPGMRRANLRAGRLHPGAGHQHADGAPAEAQPDVPVHRARPSRWSATSPAGVGVMYLGSLVEMTDAQSLYTKPLHPYTQALLSAHPDSGPKHQPHAQAHRAAGRRTKPHQPAPRLQVPHALPVCARGVQAPAARNEGNRTRTLLRLPQGVRKLVESER